MGADVKQLRARIKSVDSTMHLTGAMGLVASSKIRKATSAMERGREYRAAVEDTVTMLTSCPECQKSPYMSINDGFDKLVVIAGDRGLAGGYNANVWRLMKEIGQTETVAIGKRALDRYKNGYASAEKFTGENARELAEKLCEEFKEKKYARLGIVSTKYRSMLTQEAVVEWILPLKKSDKKTECPIFEPDEETVLSDAVVTYVAGCIAAAVKESFASEVAARKVAMDSAGKNAKKMIDELSLKYNRARQGAITQEITEIVAGSGS